MRREEGAKPARSVCRGNCRDKYGEGFDRSGETIMKSKAAIQVEPAGPLVVEEIDIPDPGVAVRSY